MTSTNIRILTCDRCDRRDEIRDAHSEYEWGVAGYSEINGSRRSHPRWRDQRNKDSDLCPDCVKGLHEWWNAPKQREPKAES